MSFCVNAAPFNSDNENISTIEKKRIHKKKNKTIKKTGDSNDSLIADLMSKLHKSPEKEDSDEGELDKFEPLPPPHVNQQERSNSPPPPDSSQYSAQGLEQPSNQKFSSASGPFPQVPTPSLDTQDFAEDNNSDGSINTEQYKNLPSLAAQQYYNQYVPNYKRMSSSPNEPNNKLLEKINYVIELLEEQHDEKTGHVTEELILYTFLGVFIIFIVDSFARAGKYTR
jgi:hypothetical protein